MSTNNNDISLAVPLAPEEVQPGTFVTVHEVILEHPLLFWCLDASIASAETIVRLPWKPCNAGTPYKVRAVCLPYVFAVTHDGMPRSFDLRLERLVRLDHEYATMMWKAYRRRSKPRKGGKSKRMRD